MTCPYLYKSATQSGVVSSATLLLIAFSTVFFPRIISSFGAPSPINFIHFLVVPGICLWALVKSSPSRSSRVTVNLLLIVLFALLLVEFFSAFINSAAFINVGLSYMLLAEPAMFLAGMVGSEFAEKDFVFFRAWIIRFSLINLAIALMQAAMLAAGLLPVSSMSVPQDNIQGVFYLTGGGHNVSASVSMSFAIYYLVSARNPFGAKKAPIWLIYTLLGAGFFQLLYADSKQTMLVIMAAWGILAATKFKKIGTLLKYAIAIGAIVYFMLWAIDNISLFRAFGTWLRPEIYGRDGVATQLKIAAFPIVTSHYDSLLNWFVGLGPGHTVSRLGGWILPEYWSLLRPLGATIHPASGEAWNRVSSVWIGSASSMFSPLFGWAGIWGDLGVLGLGVYLAIGYVVWKKLCLDDFSRFTLLSIMMHGLIFSQMEEPGFMLHCMALIFLRWKELKFKALELRPRYSQAPAIGALG
ncbi:MULTISPECIES: hypothetical protein [Cyanophyceae]|uniref:hypothetical protein n=1 Tax=Cyanophyceae TaxID=3028117 RepID=UPI001689D067|nr:MULTISPECIES: hypothetical protein [Cyanophyceae]MBD1918195.1 hypothetical protein [Phormidium sp. FACHB-77]MBD2030227.1 hypothetical protein [Phormidium sp. FACHB-322]MBD2051401.1 hypothetical protein [Leptolyngbya sp. FACHB-60]